ncbi:MAG: MotA/TolQ/ExbB proton channel family protein [Flavobacteriales bacterium]
MKKLFSVLAIAGLLVFNPVNAQDNATNQTEQVAAVADSTAQAATEVAVVEEVKVEEAAAPEVEESSVEWIKTKFIEGGPTFMAIVLVCLILGLAFVIERIIYLNLADVNTDKLLTQVEDALQSGGVEEAKDITRNTSGPVASISYQALQRISDGQNIDDVEKSVIAYGGVEMGRLERNVSWIALFIAIAPMLGFMGTVIGMVQAFDGIEREGSVDPQAMAGDIKVALLTTLFGLVVAIILQVFYNYIVAKIDGIVNKMEDASISMVDMLVKYTKK